jgi:hypothetical protein
MLNLACRLCRAVFIHNIGVAADVRRHSSSIYFAKLSSFELKTEAETGLRNKPTNKTNSVAISPQANYTD